MDLTVAVDRLPREGETVTGGELMTAFGGKGANQAVAARRLGAEVKLIACLGRDHFGDRIAEHLVSEGIPQEGLLRVPGTATGVALIVVDGRGRNQIAVAPGANERLDPETVKSHESQIDWAHVLLCQLETPIPTVLWALQSAKRRGVLTILNPAPARPLPPEIFPLVDCLTPNETEASALSGIQVNGPESAARAAERLLALGARRVVVTLGDHGALLSDGASAIHFPAFSVEAVDTTGAGDAFSGALAVELASGRLLEEAIPFANAAGALAVTRRGAQEAFPDRSRIEALLSGLTRPNHEGDRGLAEPPSP
jgi:ribokinase